MSFRADYSFQDWSGQTTENGIAVLRLVSRHPVAYATKCIKCGTETNIPHSRITYAACKNSVCGKPLRKSSRLEAEKAAARERERIAAENAARISAARMEEDTRDHRLPSRTRPQIEYVPRSAREQADIRRRREELAAEEAAEREARERPIREAEAQLQETHRRIAEVERQRLTDPEIIDVDFPHDPSLAGMDFLTPEGVSEWNSAAFKNFTSNHPEFAITSFNTRLLNTYFAKHAVPGKLLMLSTRQLEAVYSRMIACGIQFDGPEPEPDVLANGTPNYSKRPNANLNIEPANEPEKPKPVLFEGFDLLTGERRTYSEREIDRMTSEEMKRALQMTTAGTLQLPAIGPGPRGRTAQ
jgi:hypothetical protein